MAKLRLQITKGNEIRYISHLDFASTIERAIRRAKLPAAYSEGFNPHMKLAFASALAVGVTSEAEYLDIELTEKMNITQIESKLKPQLPPGIVLKAAKYMGQRSQALMAVVNLATYEIALPVVSAASENTVETSLAKFNSQEKVIYCKQSPKGQREIDIKEYLAAPVTVRKVTDSQREWNTLSLAIKIKPGGSVKPAEVLSVLVADFGLPVNQDCALIHRTGLFISDGQVQLSPMEL